MSNLPGTPMLSPDEPGSGLPPAAQRRASVQLARGSQEVQGTEELMATANKSLADALAVTLKIVQLSMFVLFGLYLISGLQSVREGQQAIRLFFGKVEASNLQPGFQFSWPYPIGDLVKVDTGNESISLDSQFWPFVDEKNRGQSIDKLSKDPRLKPDNDGSLITADNALVHAQWLIRYHRLHPERFAQNMLPPQKIGDREVNTEKEIVTAACCRGIVRAVAETKVEDLLNQASGKTRRAAEAAKSIAQKQLDELQSGIQIEEFQLTAITAPMYVRDAFNSVQSAASKAQTAIEKAESDRNQLFNATAGEIEPYLVREIDAYELAVANKDDKARTMTLDRINAMLDGTPVTVDGQVIDGKTSGEVARMISEARQYKGEVVNKRRAELANFTAKLDQYRSNPSVMLHREWSEALTAFLDRDSVQLMVVPPSLRTLELQLTEDIQLAKKRETENRKKANEEARLQREEAQKKADFTTTPKTTMGQ